LKDLLDKLIESLNNGNILPATIIVPVTLIFNYKKIVEFLDDRKKAKIAKLTEALSCEYIDGPSKVFLQEELATEHFKLTTGIRLEKEFREAIINAHRNTKGELSFIQFKRALPHLYFKDSELSVRISIFEKVGYWFNLIFGCGAVFFGLILMVLPSQINGVTLLQALSVFGMGVFSIAIAIFMLFQTFPVSSAHNIQEELEKMHSNSTQPNTNSID